jgi:hypothetical protein
MHAQPGLLVRGRYDLDPGDYVDLTFGNPYGFLIVSEPAGVYYVNVGVGCASASSPDCVWYHSAVPGGYILTGGARSVAQVAAVTAGTFQLTIGYFGSGDCDSLDTRAVRASRINWAVPANGGACFVHGARAGTMEVYQVTVGSDQSVLAYDFHALRKRVEISLESAVTPDDGIGALLMDNRDGKSSYVFYFFLDVTDPADTRLELDFTTAERAWHFSRPAEAIGEEYAFANRSLAPGGCLGVVCTAQASGLPGNTGGVPSVCDGDPIYGDDGRENLSFVVAVAAAAIAILVGIAVFLACSCWRKAMHVRAPEEMLRPLDVRDEPPGADAYEIPEKAAELAEIVDEDESPYGGVSIEYPPEPPITATPSNG